MIPDSLCQIVVFLAVIIVLAVILQRLFNPKKNRILSKYMEMEKTEEVESDPEKEKEFYEEIWNAKKSKR